jgi:hypothetical protein
LALPGRLLLGRREPPLCHGPAKQGTLDVFAANPDALLSSNLKSALCAVMFVA